MRIGNNKEYKLTPYEVGRALLAYNNELVVFKNQTTQEFWWIIKRDGTNRVVSIKLHSVDELRYTVVLYRVGKRKPEVKFTCNKSHELDGPFIKYYKRGGHECIIPYRNDRTFGVYKKYARSGRVIKTMYRTKGKWVKRPPVADYSLLVNYFINP